MASTLMDSHNMTDDVGSLSSTRILARALDGNTVIRITSTHGSQRTSSDWRVAQLDDQWIHLVRERSCGEEAALIGEGRIDVSLRLPEAEYHFATTMEAMHQVDADHLRLTRPESVTLIDRRRSARRRFRNVSQVTISAVGQRAQVRGTLLNLSVNGLACLLSTDDAAMTQPGTEILVEFLGKQRTTSFTLLARAVGLTKAGSPGRVVVGMEFVVDKRWVTCRTALQEAIETEPE